MEPGANYLRTKSIYCEHRDVAVKFLAPMSSVGWPRASRDVGSIEADPRGRGEAWAEPPNCPMASVAKPMAVTIVSLAQRLALEP